MPLQLDLHFVSYSFNLMYFYCTVLTDLTITVSFKQHICWHLRCKSLFAYTFCLVANEKLFKTFNGFWAMSRPSIAWIAPKTYPRVQSSRWLLLLIIRVRKFNSDTVQFIAENFQIFNFQGNKIKVTSLQVVVQNSKQFEPWVYQAFLG